MKNEEWIDSELAELEQTSLLRDLTTYPSVGGQIRTGDNTLLNFASNDYLNLATDKRLISAATEATEGYGAGSAASRLVTGTLPLHEQLERVLAALKGYPAGLVFGSGYLTNAGVIPALASHNDLVFADRLVHASIIDAIRLSGAKLHRFKHNDCRNLTDLLDASDDTGRRLIVTESVFSMDGDIAPLSDIAELANRYRAMLMVDEAHATGVFGPGGAGLVSELGLQDSVNISMGTLSKSLGSYGGFVTCSESMRKLLINRARAFIYTTAPAPASAGAALGAMDVIAQEPWLGAGLLENAAMLRERLAKGGLNTGGSRSQIIPVILGDNERALTASARLRSEGIIAIAMRPPTVPAGTARLRISVTLAHSPTDLTRLADLLCV